MSTAIPPIDLTQRPLHSMRPRLGGPVLLLRILDKGRAKLASKNGEREPDSDVESLASFAEYVGQHTKTREGIESWFDTLDLDAYVSLGGKP
jgi:hypothetical protein